MIKDVERLSGQAQGDSFRDRDCAPQGKIQLLLTEAAEHVSSKISLPETTHDIESSDVQLLAAGHVGIGEPDGQSIVIGTHLSEESNRRVIVAIVRRGSGNRRAVDADGSAVRADRLQVEGKAGARSLHKIEVPVPQRSGDQTARSGKAIRSGEAEILPDVVI